MALGSRGAGGLEADARRQEPESKEPPPLALSGAAPATCCRVAEEGLPQWLWRRSKPDPKESGGDLGMCRVPSKS